ncbi:hypothetical protein [Devosia sp. RR2S18]|uniref:hypothetical protein n=1 Tax=Devosia rhizosphaerae TaxID=3049774 RepID=UPI00253FF277|nr:hypothetical protein [Devosia sp. RR2S18]WIJ25103.1 hypothetical protein QOV41_19175 [Devosia sp. RR2S18]
MAKFDWKSTMIGSAVAPRGRTLVAEVQEALVEGVRRCRVGTLERPFDDLQSTRKWYFDHLEERISSSANVPDCILLNWHNQIVARITPDGKIHSHRCSGEATCQASEISPEKWQLAMMKWLGG